MPDVPLMASSSLDWWFRFTPKASEGSITDCRLKTGDLGSGDASRIYP